MGPAGELTEVVRTRVHFIELSADDIAWYIGTRGAGGEGRRLCYPGTRRQVRGLDRRVLVERGGTPHRDGGENARGGRVMRLTGASPDRPADGWSALQGPERDWPAVTRETRPWTRWWWHGSAVDRASLTADLESLRAAGHRRRGDHADLRRPRRRGAVHPVPVGRLGRHARRTRCGRRGRLDLGVDMATGTGWPFGGPWVGDDIAPRTLAHKTWTVEAGQRLPSRSGCDRRRSCDPRRRSRTDGVCRSPI